MKILIATDVFPPGSGGSGWSTFHLAGALQKCGYQVEIVLPKPGLDGIKSRSYKGLSVKEVGYRAVSVPGLRAWTTTRALERTLAAYLAARAPEFDLIHAQHLLSISAALAAKKNAHIPVVSTVRDYWAVCLYGTLWRKKAICPICCRSEITMCLAQKYGSAAYFMRLLVPLVERELQRRQHTLQNSDAVIAVSQYVAQTLSDIVPAKKLHIIPNLINVAETEKTAANFSSRIPVPSPVVRRPSSPIPTPPYLIFVGKLNVKKGADLLPQILEKSGVNIPLWVVGDGELRDNLAHTKGIQLLGWISNENTLALLARAQALLFPSRWAEPLARTLLEAQALGVPTVAFNFGGNRDIIQSDFNGLLANSVDEFTSQLKRIVSDPALDATLSANAKRTAQAKFSADVVVNQLAELYTSVLCP